jgi:hypothetical protein
MHYIYEVYCTTTDESVGSYDKLDEAHEKLLAEKEAGLHGFLIEHRQLDNGQPLDARTLDWW